MTDGLCGDCCGDAAHREGMEKVSGEPMMLSCCGDERVKRLDPKSESFKDDLKALGLFVLVSGCCDEVEEG